MSLVCLGFFTETTRLTLLEVLSQETRKDSLEPEPSNCSAHNLCDGSAAPPAKRLAPGVGVGGLNPANQNCAFLRKSPAEWGLSMGATSRRHLATEVLHTQ